jgi:hypothetical protein|tara:strand:- start:1442 stop:2068 length:627 start_codon:yes stop_codon:yes gene_type:complete
MTTLNAIDRQPTKLDYASPTQFKFSILKLPKVEYFCTAVNIPGVSLGETTQATPLKKIPIPGDTLVYEPLQMTFLVDENLENFQEIHGWLVGLGFPRDNKEFRNLLASGNDRFPTRNTSNISTEAGKTKYAAADAGPTLSDATLTVLSSKNNSQVEIRFRDMYPTGVTGLQYNQQANDIDYLTATVSFSYLIYDFAKIGSSTTSVTTS